MSILAQFVSFLARVFDFLILVRVLFSWIPLGDNRTLRTIAGLVYEATEPILGPIRRIVPLVGGLDLSPIVAILLLRLVSDMFARLA